MSKISILIVEDEGIVAENLSVKLEQLGYQVAGIAATGEKAIEMALERRPRLILMDIQLGGPLDGIQAAEAIQARHDVPVIYLTAHSDPATLARAKLTGPFGYILKPFEIRDLATQIEISLYKHQIERQVQEQREWLRVTLTSIGDAVIATDAAGFIRFINPVAESLTGWKTDEAIGEPISSVFRIINEQTGRPAEAPVARVLKEGRTVPLANHTAIVTKDGRTVPIEDSAAPILDAAEEVIGAVLVFHDVTDSRRARQALREKERRWAVTLASIGDAVIATDTEGRVTFLNPVAENLTGWQMAEAIGKPVDTVFHIIGEKTRTTVDDPVRKVLKTGKTVGLANHTVLLRKGGGEVPIDDSGAPIQDESGNIFGVVLVFRDISERRKTRMEQKAGKERQALLAQVAERLLKTEDPQTIVGDLCGLVMAHLDCQVFFNYLVEEPGKTMQLNACAGIPAKTAAEIRRLDFGEAICGCVAQASRRIIAEDIQGDDDPRSRLVRSFGTQAYCCHPLMVQDKLIGTLSFGTKTRSRFTEDEVALMKAFSDQVAVAMQRLHAKKELRRLNQTLEEKVLERTRQAETRAKQLQALAVELIEAEDRERRRVADHLHDDLQQMLAAARMQLESISWDQPTGSPLHKVRQLLEDSIEKSRRLSHELSPPVLQHANLVPALQWIVQYYKEQFGLRVELSANHRIQLDSAPLKVFMFRAVQELLFNVVKHSGVKEAGVTLTRNGGFLELAVSDTGRGLDPDILDSCTLSTGLGLLSLRERARYIGGNLVIECTPDRGSRFTLTVPLNLSQIGELKRFQNDCRPEAEVESVSGAGSGITRVLFVDDHKVMRQGLINLIGAQPGIHVAGEASNGEEAIDRVRQLKPDVVVMDVSMPVMDGIEATRQIKAQWPEVRVVGLSMIDDEHISHSMRQAGAERFVSKTASSTELLKAIFGIAPEA